MIHVIHQVRLPVPVDVAWERLADLAWLSTLNAFHRQTWLVDEWKTGAGTRLVVDHGFPVGPVVPRNVRITHWEEGRRIRWTDVDPLFPTYLFPHSEQFLLTPLGKQVTLLTDELTGTLNPRLPSVRFLDRAFARLIVRRTIVLQCTRLAREISSSRAGR